MRVLKFGGSSMADENTWRKALRIIENYDYPAIIVSATAQTTKQLIAAAELALNDYAQARSVAKAIKDRHQQIVHNFMTHCNGKADHLLAKKCNKWTEKCIKKLQEQLEYISKNRELTPGTLDAVASIGEQLSSRLFAYCGSAFGLPTMWVDAREIIKTDSEFGNAKPDTNQIEKLTKELFNQQKRKKIIIMGGYYGSDKYDNITTLGFDGSDFSASLVASALDAEAIEIWTDVSGIFTCDPLIVENAQLIKELSFHEATEMAFYGAKVLHPSTMNPAEKKNIPILVKNIFEPGLPGTIIQGEAPANRLAKSMTFLKDVVILTISSSHSKRGYDFLADVFKLLKDSHLSVKVVATTEASVSVALETQQATTDVIKSLENIGRVKIEGSQSIITLIGCSFDNTDLLINTVLSAIPNIEISILSFNNSKKHLSLVIPVEDLIYSVRAIHEKVFRHILI